jgi:hypothetical protein
VTDLKLSIELSNKPEAANKKCFLSLLFYCTYFNTPKYFTEDILKFISL